MYQLLLGLLVTISSSPPQWIKEKGTFTTATPVLVIGTTQDPATPYGWAKASSKYIVGSHLILLKGEGHTGYGRGSTCVDEAVDVYLIKRETPSKVLICKE